MRITRDIDASAQSAADLAQSTPSVPLPPPALLERAKKLGAISAGPAMFGTGAELAAVAPAGKTPRLKSPAPVKTKGKKRRR